MTLRELIEQDGLTVDEVLDAPLAPTLSERRAMEEKPTVYFAAVRSSYGPGDHLGVTEVELGWRPRGYA